MTRPHITEERIRERAYLLWIEEGQPHGKDAEHWQKARELLALESEAEEGREEAGGGYNKPGPWSEPVEEASAIENQGEFSTMTDQGEQEPPRKRRPKVSKSGSGGRPKSGGAKRRPM